MPWSVFLIDEKLPLPAPAIAKLLGEVVGGLAFDHLQHIRIHHGWVARGLEEPDAGRLVELLHAGGIPAMKKSEDRLIPLDRKFRVRKALLQDDALHLQTDLRGTTEPAPWPTLTVVSAGLVKTVSQEQVTETKKRVGFNVGMTLATGIPFPKIKKETTTTNVQVEEEKVLVHLLFAGTRGIVEIRPTEFDYGYLGARRASSSQENLLLFLQDLRRLAPGAHFTEMTSAFLATRKLEPAFKDDKDFLFFNRWITEKTASC
jgi:hypothetical protein